MFGSFGFAPANCENAATTPAMSWLSNAPKSPLQSDRTATLIGVPDPPLRGATAGWGSGAFAGAAAAGVLVLAAAGVDVLDELLSLPELPQPAATRATTDDDECEPECPPARTPNCWHSLLSS